MEEEEENNYEQIEFNNNMGYSSENLNLPNYSPLNEEIDQNQNDYNSNILNGLNSNLNVLLSNLKGNNVSSDRMRYNGTTPKIKSPIKSNKQKHRKSNFL